MKAYQRSLCSIAVGCAIGAILWVAGTATSVANAADGSLTKIKDAGTLRVAGVVYRPLILRRPSGEYEGIDIDVLTRFANSQGIKLEVVDAGWDTAVAGLGSGKWDVVPAICVTPERQKVVDFSDPVLQLGGVLVVRSDNAKIQSLEDANKADIVFADISGSWNESISKEAFPNATHKAFGQSSDEQMVLEVLSGRVDAIVTDAPVTVSMIAEKFGDKLRFFPSKDKILDVQTCPVAYAVAKGNEELKNALSHHLQQLKKDGTMEELFGKYMTETYIQEK